MEEKNKIQFKPLHEGMGFHPFSDGLPYAPESKSKYNTGAGATSAGRPQFSTPTQGAAPKVTARQLQERANASSPASQGVQPQVSIGQSPLAQMPITRHEPLGAKIGKRPLATKQKLSSAEKTAIAAVTHITDAGLLRKRAFAYLLDTVIHAGFWLATNLAALFFFKFQLDAEIVKDNLGQFIVFFLISQWMFIALQEILFENSIGKIFFNLEFRRDHGSLFLRSFVFMLGALCFGAGFYFRPQDRLGEIQLKTKIYA